MFSRRLTLCAILFAALTQARAAELVTLRTGFTVRCVSQEPISADTVRLHLRADAESYMDVPAVAIATVEAAPDEPVVVTLPGKREDCRYGCHSCRVRRET